VLVIEAKAAASGTSGQGEGNILISDKVPGAELVLFRHSLDRWDQLQDELAEHLPSGFPSIEYERKGGLVVALGSDDVGPLQDFAAGQRKVGVTAIDVDQAGALELEPQVNPAIAAAVYYPEDAQVQPVIATEALLAAVPTITAAAPGASGLRGEIGDSGRPPTGCRFNPRCPLAVDRCTAEEPQLRVVRERLTACHRAEEMTPAVPASRNGSRSGDRIGSQQVSE
jgi:oligopeptide/dipeptide ABC transporter ATP-binding protein